MSARDRPFFSRRPLPLARALLGEILVRRLPSGEARRGRIVETEAYLGPHDLACHTSKGRTPRNEVMFGVPGLAYVYFIYGMHFCVNVVAGRGAAVLIRALEPLDGSTLRLDGPARLTKAFEIDRALNGVDRGRLPAVHRGRPASAFAAGAAFAAVGLGACGPWLEKPYRFRVIWPERLQGNARSS